MALYLAPFEQRDDRVGRSDPYHVPVGWSPGAACIDLRADGGATLGGAGLNRCLLWLPVHDPDSRLDQIADTKNETLGVPTKHRIIAKLGLSRIDATQMDRVILELLRNPPANGWKPLRDHRDGVTEVWLAGLLVRSVPIRGGSTITENFNKADNGLGPDLAWTVFTGDPNDVGVTSNQANLQAGIGDHHARADSDLSTDDHYAHAEYGASHSGNTGGVLCRKDSSTTQTFYRWGRFTSAWELAKFVSGTETILHDTYTTAPASGDTLRVSADGSTIKGYHIGSPPTERASVTDSAITGNLRCGLLFNVSTNTYLDNFTASDLTPDPPPPGGPIGSFGWITA